MFPEWKTIAFLRSSCTANSPLAIMRERLQRSNSRTVWRSRSPLATLTTGSGLTLLLTVWSGTTQFTKLLPSLKRTEETHSKVRDRGGLHYHTRHYISLQSLLVALSLTHWSGQPRACLQSTTTWTNFINLRSWSQAMMKYTHRVNGGIIVWIQLLCIWCNSWL